ncbi:MAG: Hsp70 family protein [Bradymonadia bacterium]
MSAIGIDLGASVCRVAAVKEGKPTLLSDERGRQTMPAVVAEGPDGLVCGHDAERMAGAHYPLWPLKRGDHLVDAAGTEQAVAALIGEMARWAGKALGRTIDEAVVTIPADLDGPGRRLLRRAGQQVGVEIIRLMPECTAAALSHVARTPDAGVFGVLDLGASRFDVAIYQVEDDALSVLSAEGDNHLGGVDLDRAFAEVLVHDTGARWADLSEGSKSRAAAGARRAREQLSDRYVAQFSCVLDTGSPIRHPVSRDQMESALFGLLDRVKGPCREAMLQADVRPSTLDDVLLIGGLAQTPCLQVLARDVFQLQPRRGSDLDSVVALGAAIQADLMSGPEMSSVIKTLERHPLVIEGAPWSLGLESVDGTVEVLIPKCAALPASCTKRFSTWRDDQRRLDIPLVLGHGEPRWLCCEGLRAAPAGEVEVEAQFSVDPDGVLSWSAREIGSKRELSIFPVTSVQLSVSSPAPETVRSR